MRYRNVLSWLVVSLVLAWGFQAAFAQDFWQQTNGPYGGNVRSLAINSSGHIYAGTLDGSVFRSTDNGDNWTQTGLTAYWIYALTINSSGDIFAGTYNGDIFRSTDNGETWTEVLSVSRVFPLAINSSDHIFAGTNNGVFRSTDNGETWTQTGLTAIWVYALSFNSSGHIFAGTSAGISGGSVFRSTDNGETWTEVNTGLTAPSGVWSLAINSSDHIFVGTDALGVFRSTDNGNNWTQTGLTYSNVYSLEINSIGHIFAGTEGGVFRSTDNGETWIQVNTGLPYIKNISSLAINSSGEIFSGTYYGGVFRSIDNGDNWLQVNTGITKFRVMSLAINYIGHIFAGTYYGGVFRSADVGYNWAQINNGFSYTKVKSIAINSSDHIFAGTYYGGVFRSTDNGGYWTATSLTYPPWTDICCLAINSSDHIFAGTSVGDVFRSTDNGDNWTQINTGLTNTDVLSLAINSIDHIFAGTNGGGVFRSTDNGDNWTQINTSLTNTNVYALAINSIDHIFAGTNGGGVFRSTDNGDNWTQINTGLTNTDVLSLAINSSGYIFAGTRDRGVFRSVESTIEPTWQIKLSANSNGISDIDNFAGVDPNATDGFDSDWDIPEPAPSPSNYVQLYFPHLEWNHILGDNFSRDIREERDLYNNYMTWGFEVNTDLMDSTITIEASYDSVDFPEKYGILLYDVNDDELYDWLNDSLEYSYNSGSGGIHQFQLLVGPAALTYMDETFYPGWSLFSIPLEPENAYVDSVIGDDVEEYYYVFGFDQDYGYWLADSVWKGEGYWLAAVETLDVDIEGTAQIDTEVVEVSVGWNLIGMPFVQEIPKYNISVKWGETIFDLVTAVSNGWVLDVLYTYSAGDTGYILSDNLVPWSGYWFSALTDSVELLIDPTRGAGALSKTLGGPMAVANEDDWQLSINASLDGTSDILTKLGVYSEATDGFDPLFDYPEPPIQPGGDYVQVYFNYPDWLPVLGYKFNWDIREPLDSLESVYWEFEVVSTPNIEVTLSWPDINDEVPADYRAFQLNDLDAKITIENMRETTEYSFVSEGLRHFSIGAITVGISDKVTEIPKVYSLSQNYPNPFNSITTIIYELPNDSKVTLRVLDLLGREVVMLVKERQSVGYYQVSWDATYQPSGIYLYQIEAGKFQEIRKMILLK